MAIIVNVNVQRAATLFVAALDPPLARVRDITAAVTAWAYREGGNHVVYNNPWNLHGVKGDYGGLAIGDWYAGSGDVHVAKFATLADGVKATIMNLRAHRPRDRWIEVAYAGVLAAAAAGDGRLFLDRLARSPWAASRYGGPSANSLVPLYRQILSTIPIPKPPPIPIPKETTPMTLAELVKAAQQRANNLSNDPADPAHELSALNRDLELLAGRVGPIDAALAAVTEAPPLSDDPSVALAQILAATGVAPMRSGTSFDYPADSRVYDAATPAQRRELALLGFFGNPDATWQAGVDWSLFEAYYTKQVNGSWQPTDVEHPVWATYLASRG